ncbi:MAG: leucyl aminopeptidase family protein, partial [Lachnospiraceae bacterium]
MIQIVSESIKADSVRFYYEDDSCLPLQQLFQGKFLQTAWMQQEAKGVTLCVGMGRKGKDKIAIKEMCAKAVKEMKSNEIRTFSMDVGPIVEGYGIESIRDITEGAILGTYEPLKFPLNHVEEMQIELCHLKKGEQEEAHALLEETMHVAKGVLFARDMVNMPGNKLRPEDFAKAIMNFTADTGIEAELLSREQLCERNMNALLKVGDSSEYPPCLLILRYLAKPDSKKIMGLAGKGVTCDTGGYCLKPAGSMLGIKGDMAGGAAVAGAMYALAKNKVKTNVIALIPMCENRISPGSLLPGDVIDSYSGKTIEIGNTDAEGRLILADTVSYGVKKEHVTEILDIATLTGAVVNMFGFSVGGVVSDNQELFDAFRKAYGTSGERYWRLPIYPEHEKMIESKIADIRNMGENYCGTITA